MWTKIIVWLLLIIFSSNCAAVAVVGNVKRWKIGTPITTYCAPPDLNESSVNNLVEGGFNLVWSGENTLDLAHRNGLRAQIWLAQTPETLNDASQMTAVDAQIDRVKMHPAVYSYYVYDEPGASLFPALGKLVAHIRERDPAHFAYINLYPVYASNEQLGTKGDTVTAYREYLRQFIKQVKPDLLSYDHYHFAANGTDGAQYFLNLALIRQAALDARIPFMNIVQSCSYHPSIRVPNANEMRWLNYTSLAYGAQALSYYIYGYRPGHTGGFLNEDGSTTPLYTAARELNPQFVAIASQLQPLHSLGAYHTITVLLGAVALPKNSPFYLDFSGASSSLLPASGMLLGYFGKYSKPTHVLVVNLNYKSQVTTTIVGPDRLSLFDAIACKWTSADASRVVIMLPPGGGKLLRVR